MLLVGAEPEPDEPDDEDELDCDELDSEEEPLDALLDDSYKVVFIFDEATVAKRSR